MKAYIRTEEERARALEVVSKLPLPLYLRVTDKRSRSDQQNDLYQRWCRDVHEQTGYTMSEVHMQAKLDWAYPIIMRDRPADAPLIRKMLEMLDGYPVHEQATFLEGHEGTSALNVTQMTELLEKFYNKFTEFVKLTDPERI